MQIRTKKSDLEQAVFRADKITGKNLSLAVLKAVLLTATKKELVIQATNLDLGIETKISADVQKEGVVAIPGDVLTSILSNISNNEEVLLETTEGTLTVTTGNVAAKIKTYSHDDFPTFSPINNIDSSVSVPASDMVEGFKSVWYSASPSSMKPELASIRIGLDGNEFVFAATDSFRLAEKRINTKGIEDFESLLVPLKNITEIVRNLERERGEVKIIPGENQVSFITTDTRLTTRVIDGVFPDYNQIIPKEFSTEATVLKEDLIQTLRVATIFSNKFNQVQFNIDVKKKKFIVETNNAEVGESSVMVDAALSGDSLEIGFNHKYIIDSFQSLGSDSITLKFSGVGKPLVVRGVGDKTFTYLVMPMNR